MLWKKHEYEIATKKLESPQKITAQENQGVAKSLDSPQKQSKKKHRKKDKNAGLLYTVKEETKSVFKPPTLSTMKCKPAELTLTAKKQNIKLSNVKLNSDTKKKKMQSHPSKNIVVQHKQKRNNLLQLANALKTKDHQLSASSSNDKLRQMFK